MNSFFLRVFFFLFGVPVPPLSDPVNSPLLWNPKNIVVTRLQDVGDMLVFVPFLKSLRNAYPKAHITLLTRNKLGFDTICDCPYVNEVIRAGSGVVSGFLFYKRLRCLKPDLFFFSTSEFGKMKWALLAGAKVIVGYSRPKVYNFEKNVSLTEFLTIAPHFDNSKNEVENNLDLLRAVGINELTSSMDYSWIAHSDREEVDGLLRQGGILRNDVFVLFSPATKQKTKQWESQKFSELADRLHETFGVQIVFAGGPGDVPLVEQITSGMKSPSLLLAGKTTLKQLPALLARAKVTVTVDSGPMHFAAAVEAPYVAIFGPGDYHKWAHKERPDIWKNIYHEKECAPCDKQECSTLECMREVTVDEVLKEVENLLNADAKESC